MLQTSIESIEERSIQGRGDRDGRAISQTISDFLTICQELNYISDPVRLIQNAVQAVGSFMNFDYNRVNLIQPDRSFVCIASFSKKGDGASLVGSTLPTQRTSLYTELMQTGMTIFPFWAGDDGSHQQQIAISSEEQQQLFLVPLCANARNLGIMEVGLSAAENWKLNSIGCLNLLRLSASQMAGAIERLSNHSIPDASSFDSLVDELCGLSKQSSWNSRHSRRITSIVEKISRQFGCSEHEIRTNCWAGMLHDVGKNRISGEILNKPGPLTDNEWAVVHGHPEKGAAIISRIQGLEHVSPIVRAHHERFDGKGYPFRLTGRSIPAGARILSVADSYCAMTEGRVYQAARRSEDAVGEIITLSGANYDPEIVQIFVDLFNQNLLDPPDTTGTKN